MGYTTEWASVHDDPDCKSGFACSVCGSPDVRYREWESSCGGHEDTRYRCEGCGRDWWVEGPDA